MNTKFNSPLVNGKLLDWSRGTIGLAEASTLGFPAGQWPNVVLVRSHRTGAVASFLFSNVNGGVAEYRGITHENLQLRLLDD